MEYIINDINERDMNILEANNIDWCPDDMNSRNIYVPNNEEYDKAIELLGRKNSLGITTRRFPAIQKLRDTVRLVDKIAVYIDGKLVDCCVIQKDENGREFYYPSNIFTSDGLFLGRIKDAIDTIRKGLGDGFVVSEFITRTEHVIRYIDRDYGEEIRQKTIEGFKDAKFGYGVEFGYLNSFSGSRLVCKDNCL